VAEHYTIRYAGDMDTAVHGSRRGGLEFMRETWPKKIAAGNRRRAFSFDPNMKFEHHHSRLSPPPVAVAEV
jgi:hypothetical protein